MNPRIAVSDLLKNVKGETSHWINSSNLTLLKFTWQPGYGIFSVSHFNREKVKGYILKQEQHHRCVSFQEEYEKFLKWHGLVNR
jgi:REP element-mobilizing transposase RayT